MASWAAFVVLRLVHEYVAQPPCQVRATSVRSPVSDQSAGAAQLFEVVEIDQGQLPLFLGVIAVEGFHQIKQRGQPFAGQCPILFDRIFSITAREERGRRNWASANKLNAFRATFGFQ